MGRCRNKSEGYPTLRWQNIAEGTLKGFQFRSAKRKSKEKKKDLGRGRERESRRRKKTRKSLSLINTEHGRSFRNLRKFTFGKDPFFFFCS